MAHNSPFSKRSRRCIPKVKVTSHKRRKPGRPQYTVHVRKYKRKCPK